LYQPAAFGLVVGAPLNVGGTLSMLMPLTVTLAVFSALSMAVPVTDWLAALVVSVVGPEQLLTPDKSSAQLKLTATSVLFQPLALAAGLRLPLIVGAVLSSRTVTEPLPELPSLSVAVAVFVVPLAVALSVLTLSVAGVGPVPRPEPLSVALQVIAMLSLNQPAALGACGYRLALTVGPVLSRM
jgi:hypothetical protein